MYSLIKLALFFKILSGSQQQNFYQHLVNQLRHEIMVQSFFLLNSTDDGKGHSYQAVLLIFMTFKKNPCKKNPALKFFTWKRRIWKFSDSYILRHLVASNLIVDFIREQKWRGFTKNSQFYFICNHTRVVFIEKICIVWSYFMTGFSRK